MFASHVMALLLLSLLSRVRGSSENAQRPTFGEEPPDFVHFLNTKGSVIRCSSLGMPSPVISWISKDSEPVTEIPGLRYIRSDGSLVFSPFKPEDYSPEVHANIYNCRATNDLGTIVSRDSHIRAVLKQSFTPEVREEFVFVANDGVLKCTLPSLLREYLSLVSWRRDDGLLLKREQNHDSANRYMITEAGELIIRKVTSLDSAHNYECEVKHELVEETFVSNSGGKVIVTEPYASLPPRITYITQKVIAEEGSSRELVCVSQGFPEMDYKWIKDGQEVRGNNKYRLSRDNSVLTIRQVTLDEAGIYHCIATNAFGSEKEETELLVRSALSVSIVPSRVEAKAAQSVLLNCSLRGYPLTSITWLKDSHSLHGKVGYQVNGSSLRIKRMRKEDEGIYQCIARNGFQSIQASALLTFREDATGPRFGEVFVFRDTDRPLSADEPLSLKCSATGNPLPQITWSLDTFPLDDLRPELRTGDYVTSDNHVISFVNISAVKAIHGGTYSCRASNAVNSVESSGYIKVMGSPVVRSMPNLTLVSGQRMDIKCPVGGFPVNEIFWEKNGIRLPENGRQVVTTNGTLVVKEVIKAKDEGLYSCSASNLEKLRSKGNFYLTVHVKPVIEPFHLPDAVQMGQRLSMTCTVIKGDPPFSIQWKKDGDVIKDNQASSNLRVHHLADFSSTLLFKSLGADDRGSYTCLASNSVGEDSHSSQLIVLLPPKWVFEPSDMSLTKGDKVRINCRASGFPEPEISWKRSKSPSLPFESLESSFRVQTSENGTLFMETIEKADSGHYLCRASNGVGSDLSKVIKFSVYEAAHFKVKFRAETVTRGEPGRIVCEAFGEKPVKIDWTKNKEPLGSDLEKIHFAETVLKEGFISELNIKTLERRDSALYSCRASNGYGSDETTVQLIVQEPPDTPVDLKVEQIRSRTAVISWSPPFSGNSRITKYLLHLEEEYFGSRVLSASSFTRLRNLTILSSETSWTISELVPTTNYSTRISALNSLGISDPSSSIRFTTLEEVPNEFPKHIKAHPLSSTSIKVTWKDPEDRYSFGKIRGYYVGYKPFASNQAYIFKTYPVHDNSDDFKGESILKNLLRSSRYEVIVQAYNSQGAGPSSEPILVETFHEDPPKAPFIRTFSINSTTIVIELSRSEDDVNSVTGYLIRGISSRNEVFEETFPSYERSGLFSLSSLFCGTRYELSAKAFNSIGYSERSNPLFAKTAGTVAKAPDKESLIVYVNSTSVKLNLTSWRERGCPIKYFSVKYKERQETSWRVVSNRLEPANSLSSSLDGLQPKSLYLLQLEAYSEAGTSEAEYSFSTTSIHDKFRPKGDTLFYNKASFEDLMKWEVILPLVLSFSVVIAVLSLICVFMTRNPIRNMRENDDKNNELFVDLKMTELRKCDSTPQEPENQQTTELYRSSSPTGLRLMGQQVLHGSGQVFGTLRPHQSAPIRRQEECQLYATVKRTPRLPKSDRNIYDNPASLAANQRIDEEGPFHLDLVNDCRECIKCQN